MRSDRSRARYRGAPNGMGERGATLVEAALALPIVALLLMGCIDAAFFLGSHLSASYASQSAARAEVAASTDGLADYDAMAEVRKGSSGLLAGAVTKIVVYKAASRDAGPSAACQAIAPSSGVVRGVAGECNVYAPDALAASQASFASGAYANPPWPPSGRAASLHFGRDLLGVEVTAKVQLPSSVIGPTSQVMARHTVLQVEPRQA